MRMRQPRALAVALLLAFGLTASGCSTFDPTEWYSQKKPLPGERKAVFPQGVPGVAQGVPPGMAEDTVAAHGRMVAEPETVTADVAEILGRARTYREWAADHRADFR